MPLEDLVSAIVVDHPVVATCVLFALIAAARILVEKKRSKEAAKALGKAAASNLDEPITLHPEIDPALCAGCGACTAVCPEGDILRLINHKAVLVSPTKCVGHGECEASCPTGAITLVFGTKRRGMDIPRITSDYETNVPGLYIAGELGGMGLIRNAVRQGQLATRHAIEMLAKEDGKADVDTDILVVGAGPAGLASALAAIEAKRRYICIEQNSFGGTVYNFPRQKIVMLHEAELPIIGKMKFRNGKASKEDLLALWLEIRAKTGLEVREHVGLKGLTKDGDVFRAHTSAGLISARRVVLCTGVRGSPRRLGLPNEDSPKVAYMLIDADQYRGLDVAVVGSGNAAAEAVQMLAQPRLGNRVTMLIRTTGFDRCNDENKSLVLELAEKGRVSILYEASVARIEREALEVATPDGAKTVPNGQLFIFAGAELPTKFLSSVGVQIDTRFGEPLKKGKR